ncbi:hypothetical protein [Methyloversatilis sp.]|uniref:hypothetical protein n=1 Tax=Methyloversatilis sp. TaxID=2569862 RepID=UPI003D2C45A6
MEYRAKFMCGNWVANGFGKTDQQAVEAGILDSVTLRERCRTKPDQVALVVTQEYADGESLIRFVGTYLQWIIHTS